MRKSLGRRRSRGSAEQPDEEVAMALFPGPLHVCLDVAELRLNLAEVLLQLPFACSILLPTSSPVVSLILPFASATRPFT
jgi:hypothetical protein